MSISIEGEIRADGLKLAIIVARFNSFITDKLLSGAVDAFVRHGGKDEDIAIIRTPGAFEIPAALAKVVKADKYDAVICLGAVIRGGTPHFEYIAAEMSKGISAVSLESPIPVSFGVLTTDTVEQAIERAGAKSGNKGFEAAMSAIEMVNLYKQL